MRKTPVDIFTLGAVSIEIYPGGLTITRFQDGSGVPAIPHDTQEYLERARALGYGDDVGAMSREHEITHTLLTHMLTGEPSPVLWRVGHGLPDEEPDGGAEEAAVMAIQRLARLRGIDLGALLEKLTAQREGAGDAS